MSRTTSSAVEGIIELDAGDDLSPFIATATDIVDEVAADSACTHDSVRLELIERYLAAHFYTLLRPRAVQERAGSVGQTNQSRVDLYLSTSHYGQMAKQLDTNGILSQMENTARKGKRSMSVSWLGKSEANADTDLTS
ncbi:MAG: hypothetical protein Unbinned3891contig1000_82 [Prokaryotic dsDNA virus sp.]|nr:MAG: hypothetical protein Unbinned3891contig1000_82 [Prokaryotic dsDNA virus sp.]|tara:strand:- start:44837 stop:45250 length:414 start_codon:yes stop_codon:yes gene_type:complete